MSGSPYRVEFTGSARRALNRMPEKAAAAVIYLCFGPLAADPRRLGKPLKRDLTGYRTARRGDYSVVYRTDDVARLVHVVRIEHCGDVYRPR